MLTASEGHEQQTKLEEVLELLMSDVELEKIQNSIYKLQHKYSINYNYHNLNDRSENLNILANLISTVIDQDSSDYSEDPIQKKVLLTHTVIDGVDFGVCPQEGCNVKYTWNCFRHLKNHTTKDHGFQVVKVRKRRSLDQLKESTKRQYKYCPPKHYQDQNHVFNGIKVSPVIMDGQEYFICPQEGCGAKYTINSFRQLKKHTEKEHSLDVFKERKRRPIDQLKESTKRQYKYCPPKHYQERVKVDGAGCFQSTESVDGDNQDQITLSFLNVVNNIV